MSRASVAPAAGQEVYEAVYELDDNGKWFVRAPEVPGAHSQGRTRKEARANVIDALRGVLELRLGEHAINEPGGDRERLELMIA